VRSLRLAVQGGFPCALVSQIRGQPELPDLLAQRNGLSGHLFAGGGVFLSGGSVGLDNSGNLGKSVLGLLNGNGLFCDRLFNLSEATGYFGCACADITKDFGCLLGNLSAFFHGCNGGLYQLTGLLGGLGRFRGKSANLIRNDGKALSGVAGPCRFNSGVKRKNIGLESNILNHLCNASDLVGGRTDLCHRLFQMVHMLIPIGNSCPCLAN
jgi:hypothetical protein